MSKKVVNILLLGETGVGKSTFINMLGNYLAYNTLDDASVKNLLYSVPTKFAYLDDDLIEHEITVGSSSNEVTEPGASSTQNPRSYLYNLRDQNVILRVIDTPGIGDTRGMKYDEWNTEKLLTFISELEYLNAVCVTLKPNNSRFNLMFEYCMKHILLRLDRRIKENIVFLFTNARSSFYRPGDTFVPLRMMLQQVESGPLKTKIPLNSENIFCIDNESFRYLAARSKDIQFSADVAQEYRNSWNQSSTTVKRMLQYCTNLNPVPMQGIVTINESRRIIMRLAKPVIDLMIAYEKILLRLSDHEKELEESQENIDDLKTKLYVPVMETYIVEKTIVSDSHREEGLNFGIGISVKPPYITNLNLGYKYNHTNNVHVEEKLASRERIVRDQQIDAMLKKEKKVNETIKMQVEKLKTQSEEYQSEAKTILSIVAKFIVFLMENSIISSVDPFQHYLQTVIEEETSSGGSEKLIDNLQKLLNRYESRKQTTFDIHPEDIRLAMDKLIKLKNTGKSFKQIMDKKYQFNDEIALS